MRAGRSIPFLLITLLVTTAVARPREFPTNRDALRRGDWFPYVFSKLAPLEWWNFASSLDGIQRKDYPSDFAYALAKQDTRNFPRFCFSFFRASPKVLVGLQPVFDEYQGEVSWLMLDDCIIPVTGKPPFYVVMAPELASSSDPKADAKKIAELMEHMAKNPPRADPELVKKAMADAPRFCAWLEDRLGLKDKPPLLFDPSWLSREGLATSRGPFEDFVEPGAWSVSLALDPQSYATAQGATSPKDLSLSFGIGMFEQEALFEELGANWDDYRASGSQGPVLAQYPLLSRLDDMTEDALYSPEEINSLLAECVRAQDKVKDPRSIRALDKLVRIARWAQELKLGIYFGGQ